MKPMSGRVVLLIMARQGARVFVECGPGRVLSSLLRRIDGELQSHSLASRDSCDKARNAMAKLSL